MFREKKRKTDFVQTPCTLRGERRDLIFIPPEWKKAVTKSKGGRGIRSQKIPKTVSST